MTRSRPALALAGAALAFAVTVPSAAAATRSPDLWATVNVCNTQNAPNKMGVRARMPGDGRRERMYMRFIAQYRTRSGWKVVTGRGVSRWLYAGSALFKHEELGYTFSFDAPNPGSGFVLRGLVKFEWRAHRHVNGHLRWVVVHRTHRATRAGHPSHDADPPRYSAATCQIGEPSTGD